MRNVVLYIAMSVDGFIADAHGDVGWLNVGQSGADEACSDNPDGYSEFIQGIDTIILGYTTYHQIVTQLSPDSWPYAGMTSYVLTHKQLPSSDSVQFINTDSTELIRQLRQKEGKDIWVCGGASLVNQLIKMNLIDRYHITVIPILLGNGIRLFHNDNVEVKLNLVSVRTNSGLAELLYEADKGTELDR